MQKEIYQKVKGKKTGDVIVTKGYKLQCRYVFHGALSHFNSEKTSGVSGVKVNVPVLHFWLLNL